MTGFDPGSISQFGGVKNVLYVSSATSTSDLAKQKLLESRSIHLPLLVLCDHQTAGRGQRGNSWESNGHSLTFTWCVSVNSVPTENHALLPLIAGLSVCEAIESSGVKGPKLKWPNDVLLSRKKVCGILVEKISSGDQAWFLIGIGINVNQTAAELESLGSSRSDIPPGSLRMFLRTEIQKQLLLEYAIRQVHKNTSAERNWSQELDGRFEFLGEQIKFTKPDGDAVRGTFCGVDDSGQILIKIDGETCAFASGRCSPID